MVNVVEAVAEEFRREDATLYMNVSIQGGFLRFEEYKAGLDK